MKNRKDQKPYIFGTRGISAVASILWNKYPICVRFKVKYQGKSPDRNFVNFTYTVTQIYVNARKCAFDYFKSKRKSILFDMMTDLDIKQIEDASVVQVGSSSMSWSMPNKMPEIHNTVFNPFSRAHFQYAIKLFVNGVEHKRVEVALPKEALDSCVRKTNDILQVKEAQFLETAKNREVRKTQTRVSFAYLSADKIMASLFQDKYVTEFESCGAPVTEMRLGTLLEVPPFHGSVNSAADIHESGPSSFLVSFGIDPYPYAVILTGHLEKLGSCHLVKNDQLWVAALVNGEIILESLKVPHTLPEDQLELAALMAIGVGKGRKNGLDQYQ